MDIKQIKQARPEWSTLSDSQVVDMVHQLDYPDLPKDQVARALGVTLEAPKPPTMPGRGVTGWARDLGISALKGAIAVPEAAVGLADIATGGQAGKTLEGLGYRPAEARAILDDFQTEQAKQANQSVQSADGVMGTLGAVIDNPSVIPQAIVESAPLMVGGGGVARGLMKVAPQLGVLGAAAAGEGIVSAGSSAEQIRQQTADGLLTGKQAGLAATIGALTGGLGALGGKIAKKLGIGDVDTMIAQGSLDAGVRKGVVRSALEGAVSEGILEELPQSVQEQALQNLALGKPIDEGVDQAAVLGALTGAAMGGGAAAIARPQVHNNGPLSRGANLALDQAHKEAQALRPVAPGLTPGQEDQAMSSIMAQGDADMQAIKQAGIRDNGPSLYPDAAQPIPGMAGQLDPLSQSAEPFDALGDRILTTRQTLDDEGNRNAIRQKFGQSALDEVLYYLNQADRPGQIPDKTRENMLALAEEIVSRSRLTPVEPPPTVGAGGFSPMARLGADAGLPQIGLDTTPTGVMRADAQGNVAPETAADAIQTRQAQADFNARKQGGSGMEGHTPRDTMRGAGPGVMVGEGTLTTPARPTRQQTAAGPVPRLVYRPNGEPFKNQRAAVLEQRRVGGDVVPVEGGWAVQTQGEASDVRGGQALAAAERSGAVGPSDAQPGMESNGPVAAAGRLADAGRSGATAVGNGDGGNSASAVAVGATGRGIGEALNEQGQPENTQPTTTAQAPQEAVDPRGAAPAGAGEQGGGVPRAGGRADAQADGVKKTPEFLKAKTIPQMTDEELRQAAEFYGPKHKRAKTIEKEMAKRAPKVPAVAEPALGSRVQRLQTELANGGKIVDGVLRQSNGMNVMKLDESELAQVPANKKDTSEAIKERRDDVYPGAQEGQEAQSKAPTEEVSAEQPTHQDPGEAAEPATKTVVGESLAKAARKEESTPGEMRKWLLGEVDKKLLAAPDREDFDSLVKTMGEKDAISSYTGNGLFGKDVEVSYVTFDVPGDGKFNVRNSMRGLLEFRKKVESSPGFKDNGQRQTREPSGDAFSSGRASAIKNMVEEGDYQAAVDYADAVGLDPLEVKLTGDSAKKFKAFLDRREEFAGDEPAAPDAVDESQPEVAAPTSTAEQQAARATTTDAQQKAAEAHAKDLGGRVVWQEGDIALVEGHSILSGDAVYVAANGATRTRVDISAYKGAGFTAEQKVKLLEARAEAVNAAEAELARNPDGPFKAGRLVFAEDITPKVADVAKGWAGLLGLDGARIVVTTPESGAAMAQGLAGRFRRIGKANLSGDNVNGTMQPLGGGDFHIAIRPQGSVLKTLEVLAHEMGHIAERQAFTQADASTQAAIRKAHADWMAANGQGKAVDMAQSMRPLRSGENTGFGNDAMAKDASAYWKSFGEWFADQVSRWATTQDKPLSVVDNFFHRLGQALRAFFVGERAKFKPGAVMTKWLDSLSKDVPPVDAPGEASQEAATAEVATPLQEAPQVTEAEARKRLKWRDLGQQDGTKTWGLYYDEGDGRGMRYGTVSKFAGSHWEVENHDGGNFEGLQPAKTKAEDLAVERLRRDGYVIGAEVSPQANPGAAQGEEAGGSRPAPVVPVRQAAQAARKTAITSKIEDIGEKIGGARKDVWTSFKDDLNAVGDGDIVNQPLSKIWPTQDYQKLIEGGVDADAVALVRSMRDEIQAKPRSAWKVKRWAEQVKTLRQFANDILAGTTDAAKFRDSAKGLSAISNTVIGRADLYLEVGHAKSLEGITLAHRHYTLYRGRENVSLWAVERKAAATAFSNWPQEIATADTKEQAIAAFKERYGNLDAEKEVKKASFDVFSMGGKFYVGKKIGRNLAKLAGPFATVKEARDHRLNNLPGLEKALEAHKEIPSERRDVNNPRVGEDMRNGQDVTPDFFAQTFGFRGVEFGNWVEQKRRQKDLNDAFDALMDMAAVMGVPPRAMSLNGQLGLAFGARGSGGKNAAAAHYEPSKVVINLTKREGAGSLGHEWWHALDNYFSRMRAKGGDMMTEALDVSLSSRGAPFHPNGSVRKEMIEAFGKVVSSIRQTAMKARASKLDAKRTKEYWTTDPEMSARAFESYLISKLQDHSVANDYLANIVSPETWKAAEAIGFELDDSYPYPTAGEIPAIREAFDHLFQTVETRKDGDNVAMFSRDLQSEDGVSQADSGEGFRRQDAIAAIAHMDMVEDLVRQLTDGWKNAPEIVVLRSMEEAPEAVRRENDRQLANGATGEPEAFYHHGRAYLLASHMRSMNDVRRAVFHEVLGHLGMRGLYGTEIGEILDQVARARRSDVEAKARQYGLDMKNARDRQIAAEEWLAEIAQENPQMGFVQRAVAAIRSWLRRNAPALAKMRMSDDEIIRELIVPVQRFIKDGPPDGGMGLLPAFRRDRGFSRGEGQRVVVKRDESGERVYASDGVTLAFPIESERLEVIPGPGQKILNYAIMPSDSFDVLGNMEVLVENGDPVSILDINVEGKNKGVGAKAVGMLLAAHPATDMNVSNIVPSAQGFWEKIGIPTQNREEGAAYDGTINHATYLDAQAGRGAQGVLAEDQGQNRQADARAEGSAPQALGGEEVGFSRTQAAQQFTGKAREAVQDFFGSAGAQVDWLDRTFKTQFAKAQKFPQFGRVFSKVQEYIEGVSTLANQAADNAPSILPKLEGWRDLAKTGLKPADAKAVAAPLFQGTLEWTRVDGELVSIDDARTDGFEGEAGVVFTDSELRERFGLNDSQVASYREFRAAVDESLDQLVSSEVIRLLGDVPAEVKAMAMSKDGRARLRQVIAESFEKQDDPLLQQVNDKFDHVARMKEHGYTPLSRFGKFWVHVVDQEGQTQYFGMAETRTEANRLARNLREEFPQAGVEQGVMSQELHKLMSAVPLDAMELFASAIGADQSEVFQKYIQLAKNNRSTMKRLMKRKGTAGFSEDVSRVLASFVTSNARASSTALNIKDAKDLAAAIQEGDIKDEAIKMIEAVTEPEESGAAIRGVMFTNFIGGSIASAVVNITQPVMMTLPYLSQWGGAVKAGARLVNAARMIVAGVDEASEIGKALKRAENEGIVSPQEIHQLIARASGGISGRNLYLQKLALLWSGPFSVAEQFNRQVSFLAAYQTAQAEGIADPFSFAEKAVIETQGLYNAGNKPNVARGVMGATAMTFKQYSIHYLEWLARMAKSGPEGKKAAVLALAMLVMAAGSDGLPFADDLDDVLDTVGQAMGYDTNTKRARREMVASVLGEEMAEVATRGFSAAAGFPVDLSIRMGMGNLLPATDLLKKSNTDTARSLSEVAGPGGAMFMQYRDAARALLNGDIEGAVQKLSPVALQNLAKAAKMADTGEYRDQRDRKVTDVDATDVGMKALSFQPAHIARESARMAEARQSEMLAKAVESEITDKWARAIADGDKEAEKEALKMRDDWNEKNPDQPIVMKRSQAVRKARNMKMDRRDRFIKSVAPERRALVDKEIS